jgi:hypothetical protein
MRFAVFGMVVALVVSSAGCSRPDPHTQILEQQTAVFKEALPLFQSVKDKASADAAAPKLTELHQKLVELRQQQKALGRSEAVKQEPYKKFVAAGAAVAQEWLRLQFKNPVTGKFGGVEGAEGIVAEWDDVMKALKEPLENSK